MTITVSTTDTSTISVHNPADGRHVGTVPTDSPDTVAGKARELRAFQPGIITPWNFPFTMRAFGGHGVRRFGLSPKGSRGGRP